jgi:hypothetical protein
MPRQMDNAATFDVASGDCSPLESNAEILQRLAQLLQRQGPAHANESLRRQLLDLATAERDAAHREVEPFFGEPDLNSNYPSHQQAGRPVRHPVWNQLDTDLVDVDGMLHSATTDDPGAFDGLTDFGSGVFPGTSNFVGTGQLGSMDVSPSTAAAVPGSHAADVHASLTWLDATTPASMSGVYSLSPAHAQDNMSSSQDESDAAALDSDEAEPDLKVLTDSSGSAGSGWSLVHHASNETATVTPPRGAGTVAAEWHPYDPLQQQLPVRSSKKQRGPFQDPQKRARTSATRRLKACVRCRMQKLRVSFVSTCSLVHPFTTERTEN